VSRFTLLGQTDSSPKTNLAICFEIIDSTVTEEVSKIDKSDVKTFSLNLVSNYSIFTNFVSDRFTRGDLTKHEGNQIQSNINFTITNISVKYSEPRKEKFFGEYSVERSIYIEGSFLFNGTRNDLVTFNKTHTDFLPYSSIKDVEDESLPFTKGAIPEPPIFSTILEPLIIVGSAALVVYLFFSVRGK
jgi:hypothetical protein